MNPDDFVEMFVSSIIVIVTAVVGIYLVNPTLGDRLIGILPDVVTLAVNAFLVVFILLIVYQLVGDF